jgi:hypothetical protein
MPNAFIAAVIGSEKNTGSTRSTMSPETCNGSRGFEMSPPFRLPIFLLGRLELPTLFGVADELGGIQPLCGSLAEPHCH